MSTLRRLLLVLLLAVALPFQSFAAVTMSCGPTHAGTAGDPHGAAQHGDEPDGQPSAQRAHPHTADSGGQHHAHPCASCASCCVGAALGGPAVPAVHAGAAHDARPLGLAAPQASFLTDGIERPPRPALV
ncbi:hypothetical protein [Burkholderia alba]|uniref:hypothetical protein n=1 Tax=Burkholderia alba TaxID=2683677 RepID=UPI002B060D70|nr:hypothetical protein [Burkholderia alba]